VALGFEPWLGDGPSTREWFEDYWVQIRENPPAVIGIAFSEKCARPAAGRIDMTLRDRAGTKIGGERLLVVTETCYPGWRAYVDGERRAMQLVAGTFCGLPVQDGDTRVCLVFMPESVQIGIFLTLVGLGALGALLVGAGLLRKAVST